MTKKGIILTVCGIGLLSLVGFNYMPGEKPAADGYLFKNKEYTWTEFVVKVNLVKSSKEFRELRGQYLRGSGLDLEERSQVAAFSVLRKSEDGEYKECEVFIKDPAWEYEPEYMGHEFAHCIFGRWHKMGDYK